MNLLCGARSEVYAPLVLKNMYFMYVINTNYMKSKNLEDILKESFRIFYRVTHLDGYNLLLTEVWEILATGGPIQ